MTDHTEILSNLPREVRHDLMARSDSAGLRHLAGYLGALALMSVWIVSGLPLWGFGVFAQGVLLCFLFTLSHEATHQTPFRSRLLNETVGHAIAPVIGLPFVWFRYFHLAHHKHTNDPERDPEIAGHPRPQDRRSFALYLSGWLYWRSMITGLLANARGRIDAPYLPPRKHRAMIVEARIILSVQGLALLSLTMSPLAFWLWLLPVVVGQPVLRLYLLAEHGLCPPVANMLENTRTTFTSRLIRWLAWNMPFHIEHHSAPNVPFHKLPELHGHMAPHLVSTSNGYSEFTKDYAAQLK